MNDEKLWNMIEGNLGRPLRTIPSNVGRGHEREEPDTILILNDRKPGDFTEDDEVWQFPQTSVAEPPRPFNRFEGEF